MVIRADLASVLDQSVWISDDRISALASLRSGGIEQVDFHGLQPVSRNAKLLQHPAGVLKFELQWQAGSKARRISLDWRNLTIYPFGIEQIHYQKEFTVRTRIAVKHNQLSVFCRCFSEHQGGLPDDLKFRVLWNLNSRTRDVHGERSWHELTRPNPGAILLKATDQIHLWQWLQRQGDYQGDFLIPEDWRRMIFKRDCVSGTASREDLKEEFRQTRLKLYDADTFIVIGNSNFACSRTDNSRIAFESTAPQSDQESLLFPQFTLQFFAGEPQPGDSGKPGMETRRLWNPQIRRYRKLQAKLPQLELRQFPGVEAFFGLAPQIIESAKVKDYGMTRACPGTYYWLWSWDNMVTAQAMARYGDLSTMSRMVGFLRHFRDIDGAIPGRWTRQLEAMDSRKTGGLDFLFCELVFRLYIETLDRSVLQNNYAALHRVFRHVSQLCNGRGLFPTIGMYPDLPGKMGRMGRDLVAIDAGMWYCFCRNLEKIALILGDTATAAHAIEYANAVRINYLDLFWDNETGFLCDSVNPESGKRNRSFPIYSLLFMEFPFGKALLRGKEQACSDFIEKHLLSDSGIRVTPTWDINHTSEPVMSAWYPHWDFPATSVLALAKRTTALNKWLQAVEECYEALGYCPEFVALDVPQQEKFKQHGAAWNLNCAAGWYNSIIQNAAGMTFDAGGITLRPTNVIEMSIENLWFRNGHWDVHVCGEGDFIQQLNIDAGDISGTWKVPSSFYSEGKHELQLELGQQPPPHPVLTELWGGTIHDVTQNRNSTQYHVHGLGQTDLTFISLNRPQLVLDGKELDFIWDSENHQGHCRLSLSGGHQLYLIEVNA